MIAKIIPSESETNEKGAKNDNEGTEDKSGSANDPRKGEMEADKAGEGKTTNRRNSAKARPRPKTAPPSRHPTVESIFQWKIIRICFYFWARANITLLHIIHICICIHNWYASGM